MGIIDNGKVIHSLGMKLRQVGRIYVGRITGTVPSTNGAYKTLISLIERSLFMRAELNALVFLLLKKGVFKEDEWVKQLEEEMEHYFGEISKEFPEVEFDDWGMTVKDIKAFTERSQKEGWPP